MKVQDAAASGGLAAAACVACCAPPIIAALGVTAGIAATLGIFVSITAAIGALLLGATWIATRARQRDATALPMDGPVLVPAPTRRVNR